jgi:transposase
VRTADPDALTETELAELKRLRKKKAELKMDREILLKASVFFAKETNH